MSSQSGSDHTGREQNAFPLPAFVRPPPGGPAEFSPGPPPRGPAALSGRGRVPQLKPLPQPLSAKPADPILSATLQPTCPPDHASSDEFGLERDAVPSLRRCCELCLRCEGEDVRPCPDCPVCPIPQPLPLSRRLSDQQKPLPQSLGSYTSTSCQTDPLPQPIFQGNSPYVAQESFFIDNYDDPAPWALPGNKCSQGPWTRADSYNAWRLGIFPLNKDR